MNDFDFHWIREFKLIMVFFTLLVDTKNCYNCYKKFLVYQLPSRNSPLLYNAQLLELFDSFLSQHSAALSAHGISLPSEDCRKKERWSRRSSVLSRSPPMIEYTKFTTHCSNYDQSSVIFSDCRAFFTQWHLCVGVSHNLKSKK